LFFLFADSGDKSVIALNPSLPASDQTDAGILFAGSRTVDGGH